ncbi:MAG: hypothetical protein AB7O62_14540 [Pirellulales bacterium]
MKDETTPATKADIKMLMDSIGKLYDANERWKDQILTANERWKDETIRRFDVIAEQLRHDVLSAFRDFTVQMNERTNSHETRIRRLEVRMGIEA